MTRNLWLDLEDTIIAPVTNGWPQTSLVNEEKILAFIEEYKPDHVHIFSFAIWNQFEFRAFQLFTQPMIERVLMIKLDVIPTVDDHIIKACCRVMKMAHEYVDFEEMSNFWGKHEAFRLFLRDRYKSGSVETDHVLLDDAVFNEEFVWPDLKIKGRVLNIDQMK
jgi:hypothetical protein